MSDAVRDLRQAGFFSALDAQLSRHLCRLAGEQDPLVALGVAAANRAVMHGHVCLDLAAVAGEAIVDDRGDAVVATPWPALDPWRAALSRSALVATDPDAEQARPLVLAGTRLYLTRYFRYEQTLARDLLERAGRSALLGAEADLEADLDALFDPDPGSPERDQRAAARVALGRALTVISGGPGTGKTATVARILALVHRRWPAGDPPRVLLAAPTGKAAKRLTESLRSALSATGPRRIPCDEALRARLLEMEASTLHRALGASADGARYRHGPDHPLSADVVLVDEASMIDLALMTRLVGALAPDARLILLGDRHQLASVEAGAILGDMVTPRSFAETSAKKNQLSDCITELRHSFRFDARSGIGQLADAVLRGDEDATLALLQDPDQTDVHLAPPEETAAKLDAAAEAYQKALHAATSGEGLSALDGFRVLCALRQGPSGVVAFNERLARRLGLDLSRGPQPGLPLMVLQNDHQLRLYNGDVGLVARDGDDLRVFFADRERPLLPARLPAHEPALALTVHKSQGSEFHRVLVVLPDKPSPLLTRELLYTAITRARQEVIVLGGEDILRAAIATPVARMSGLRELLSWPCNPPCPPRSPMR